MATYAELRGLFGHGDLRNKMDVSVIVANKASSTAILSMDAGCVSASLLSCENPISPAGRSCRCGGH